VKTKLFIVTYDAVNQLHDNLVSLFNSDYITNPENEIYIINNHSNFLINSQFSDRVKVLHNQTRPDFSTGHLSRNWNQALIHGFKNLSSPDSDLVITAQDDTTYEPNFYSRLLYHHEKYTFISSGAGDQLCSYTCEAVKNIGIWDERFCNIGFQEADYFLRARLYNSHKSSINDECHHREWNTINEKLVTRPQEPDGKFLPRSLSSFLYHDISLKFFEKKWHVTAAFWDHPQFEFLLAKEKMPHIETYVTYPFFEKDLYNHKEKGYFQFEV
jgi:hypothetical protein